MAKVLIIGTSGNIGLEEISNAKNIEASLGPVVTISPERKITNLNEASLKVKGLPRLKLFKTDFSDYFTEPQKARKGYKEVF